MSDRYLELVNSGAGKTVATRLGLPRPAALRRYRPDAALLDGPLLLGQLGAGLPGLSQLLSAAGVEVATPDEQSTRWGALVFDATAAGTPDDLGELRAFLSGALRRLRSSGRVLLLGRAPDGASAAADATRQALDGIVRSLAKELRAGATANLIQLTADASAADLDAPVRFFLSGRSAYVDGQVLAVDHGSGPAPADWAKPLDGRVALVTGAARGIGASIADVLSRDGATVVVADLPAAGEALARVANRIGGTSLQLDIAAPDATGRLTEYLRGRHGGVDIVIHNAGITRDKLLANMKPELWDSVLSVNLQSQLRINQSLIEEGTLRTGGRVVCLASTSGIAGNRGQTNYAASKAGVIGMVRSMAPAFAAKQATINAVAPGFIDTEMTRSIPLLTREVARRLSSLQQAGLPVDVAETIAFLSQSGAGGVNGQVLRVCGQNLVGA
ncbi:MAG: 3-oxoacyl-ACP reductase [Actinomycetota bacterium]|nr:3-oxoacyl-ACP reductase [Actinomycetota bacterium]